jgi:lysophospholipase L1-like esterase
MKQKWRIVTGGAILALAGCTSANKPADEKQFAVAVGEQAMASKTPTTSAGTSTAPSRAITPPTTGAAPRVPVTPERADVGIVRGGANPDRNWIGKHNRFVEKAKKGGIDIYFEGDSITEQWLGPGKPVWDKEYGAMKAASFGVGGDRTQHVIYRLENGELDGVDPKLFVLMIGTNNVGSYKPEDTAAGVKKIVSIMRERKPNAKILLLAIFPRGADAKDGARKKNVAVNEIISKLDDGKMIRYLDIGDKFLDKDGSLSKEISPDLLHFNAKGYQIWADAIRLPIAEMLK